MAATMALRLVPRNLANHTLHAPFASFMIHGTRGGLARPRTCDVSLVPSSGNFGVANRREAPSPKDGDSVLSGLVANLSLSPAELSLTREYLLPSVFPAGGGGTRVAILDPLADIRRRDCPTNDGQRGDMVERPFGGRGARIEAPGCGSTTVEKQAKMIMKIRRKKMKKHQYRKWKKRNKFKLRALLAKRRKKKLKLWEEHLDGYRFKGLTSEHIELHLSKRKEEGTIFLRHLGIPVEEGTPESVEEEEKRQKLKDRKETVYYDPKGSMKVIPTPILPEGSSLRRVFEEEERKAKEQMVVGAEERR